MDLPNIARLCGTRTLLRSHSFKWDSSFIGGPLRVRRTIRADKLAYLEFGR